MCPKNAHARELRPLIKTFLRIHNPFETSWRAGVFRMAARLALIRLGGGGSKGAGWGGGAGRGSETTSCGALST